MSFVAEFNSLPLDSVFRRCLSTTTDVAREILGKSPVHGELLFMRLWT